MEWKRSRSSGGNQRALRRLQRAHSQLRRRCEELERRQQTALRLFSLAPQPYVVTDRTGLIRAANLAVAHMLGRDVNELVGVELLRFADPGQAPILERLLHEAVPGAPGTGNVVLRRDSGEPVVAAVTVAVDHEPDGDRLLWQLPDVTASVAAQAALRSSLAATHDEAEQLREVDRWKDAFLAAAAHDLRLPISVIITAAATLQRPGLTADQHRSVAESISRHAEHLNELITDLLDLDRFTRGTVSAERSATDLSLLVQRVLDRVTLDDHELDVEPVAPVVADIDAMRVEQILTNLLGNAVQHTPAGTRIRARVATYDDGVEIMVEDDGPGVPEVVREHVFAPFVSHATHADDRRGTGIGLSLVELFAELHGGFAQIEDSDSGGARFVVRLPATTRPRDVA